MPRLSASLSLLRAGSSRPLALRSSLPQRRTFASASCSSSSSSSSPASSTSSSLVSHRSHPSFLRSRLTRSFHSSSSPCSSSSSSTTSTTASPTRVEPSKLTRAEIESRVIEQISKYDKVDAAKVTATATFQELGLDSLDGVEIVMKLEDEFAIEINDQDAEKIQSVKSAIDFIAQQENAK